MASTSGSTSFSAMAARLTDTAVVPDEILKTLGELRDRLEVVHTPEYPRFLDLVLPGLVSLLTRAPPQLQEGTAHRYVSQRLCRAM